jgi:hypothetical protein
MSAGKRTPPTGSTPPADLEAEQAVLGSIFVRPQVLEKICEVLDPGDFYWTAHGIIYETMLEVLRAGHPLDYVTVTARLKERGKLEDVGGQTYITALYEKVGFATNAHFYASMVRDKSVVRRLLTCSQEIAAACLAPGAQPSDLLLFAESQIQDLVTRNGFQKKTFNTIIRTVDEFLSLEAPERNIIIRPFLKEASINMIYGWRGVGKSNFALGLVTAATTGEPIGPWDVVNPVNALYCDGEMAWQDLVDRLKGFSTKGRKGRLYIYSVAFANSLGMPRANLLDEKWRMAMKDFLIDKDIKLWIADNIASLAPGIDENSKQDWDPINQWFLDLRFAGINTTFLHHENKEGGQRGTAAREDNIDISIQLCKPSNYFVEDGARFIVKFQKTRIRHEELHLIGDTEFSLETGDGGNYFWTFKSLKKRIKVEVLQRLDGGMGTTEIGKALGLSKGRVSQIKSEALRDGLITEKGKLTPKGFEYLLG